MGASAKSTTGVMVVAERDWGDQSIRGKALRAARPASKSRTSQRCERHHIAGWCTRSADAERHGARSASATTRLARAAAIIVSYQERAAAMRRASRNGIANNLPTPASVRKCSKFSAAGRGT
jgi:hypothetical protein